MNIANSLRKCGFDFLLIFVDSFIRLPRCYHKVLHNRNQNSLFQYSEKIKKRVIHVGCGLPTVSSGNRDLFDPEEVGKLKGSGECSNRINFGFKYSHKVHNNGNNQTDYSNIFTRGHLLDDAIYRTRSIDYQKFVDSDTDTNQYVFGKGDREASSVYPSTTRINRTKGDRLTVDVHPTIFQSYQSCMSIKLPSFRIPDDEAKSLSQEQRLVVECVLSGYSIFVTGPAGSGKSHILENILRLNEMGISGKKKNIVITATTGLAACNIGGVTIHSFAGMGTGKGPLANIMARVIANDQVKQRWKDCDILVIDEISMMTSDFFDKLSTVASHARNNTLPFGGIQLVICGDFYQLPPINIRKNKFAFEAKVWPIAITTSICLTSVFRQNQDVRFVKILNEARVGKMSKDSIDILHRHSYLSTLGSLAKSPSTTKVQSTLIDCKNARVDALNKNELDKLRGEAKIFMAKDWFNNTRYRSQLKQCPALEVLELKLGATVLLLKNLDRKAGLMNGVRGVVKKFIQVSTFEVLPLIHFESSSITKLIRPCEWTYKLGNQVVASRIQLPLKLGYALSVHKSQGMTIANVSIDLSHTFEYGQAYVALSRARSMSSLTLRGFHQDHFQVHPTVSCFYSMLESIQMISDSSRGYKKRSLDVSYNEDGQTNASTFDNLTGLSSIIREGNFDKTDVHSNRIPIKVVFINACRNVHRFIHRILAFFLSIIHSFLFLLRLIMR